MDLKVKYILFAILSLINFIIMYYSLFFPKCVLCGKRKIRVIFKYVINDSLNIWGKGQLAVCQKCAHKYDIQHCEKCRSKIEIIKRAEYKSKYL